MQVTLGPYIVGRKRYAPLKGNSTHPKWLV